MRYNSALARIPLKAPDTMAGSSLLTLIDDIATLLDDVAFLSKMAAQKTAGVLGDDLALNAQQVSGVAAERELPVVWAVAKGSLRNKAILVPAALAISATLPWAVTPLLMVGGAYLCFEGFEKIAHQFLHGEDDVAHERALAEALMDPAVDLLALERERIQGAIRTDFILSAEIIAITLGTVAAAGLGTQLLVLAGVAALMTVGVYGFVAGIVKLDDLGLYLQRRRAALAQRLGGSVHWQLIAKTGHTTADALAAFEASAAQAADVLVTALGVNDVVSQVSPRRWAHQLRLLHELAVQRAGVRYSLHSAVPPMHAFPLLPQPLRWLLGAHALRMNRMLARSLLGDARRGLQALPPHLHGAAAAELMAPDGFHPGPAGYQLWADALAERIVREWSQITFSSR